MRLQVENPDLQSIIRACLRHIESTRPTLMRTKSQTPATSALWFIESDLKSIATPQDFLTWVTEKFSPQYLQHRLDRNSHVATVFNTLAAEILKQIQESTCFDKENQQIINNLIGKEQMKKSSESSTPVQTLPLDEELCSAAEDKEEKQGSRLKRQLSFTQSLQ